MEDEVKITFDYLLGIFIVGHAKFPVYLMNLDTDKILIEYEDYVKSHLHLDVISDFYNKDVRSIYQYHNARKYIKGDMKHRNDAVAVLRFMFEDIAAYLIKVPTVYHIRLDYPKELLSFSFTDEEKDRLCLEFRRFVRTALYNTEWEKQFYDVEPLDESMFLKMSSEDAYSNSIVQLIKRTHEESLSAEDIATRYENLEQALVLLELVNRFGQSMERGDIAV